MKKIMNKILALTLLISVVSCDSLLDINEDPNAASTANIEQVLSSGQARVAYLVSRYLNDPVAHLWPQYWAWGPGVALGPDDKHEYFATNSNGLWSVAYASAMEDLKFVSDSGEPLYVAIASLMEAYTIGVLVDNFGNVPFTEANQGLENNLNPVFDDAATIYAALVTKVGEAVETLTNPPINSQEPGDEDLIYAGDLDGWIAFGNSLKLKLLVRQAENGGPADLATQISDHVTAVAGNFITSSSQNTTLEWIGASGSENPFFAVTESGLGNFYVLSNTSKTVLETLGDPRLNILYDLPADGSTTHVGTQNGTQPSGDATNYSSPSAVVYGPGLPSILMSAAEVWFYRAEAAERFATEDPVTTFEAGVTEAFDYIGAVGVGVYLSNINYTTSTNRLKDLGTQMWIAFNGIQPAEGWITTRKFDNAARPMFATSGGVFVSPETNSLGVDVYPSILLYPQTEIDLNPNSPAQNSLTGKVFWDN